MHRTRLRAANAYKDENGTMRLGILRQKNDLLLLASLFLFELSLAVILMATYIRGERPFVVFLPSKPGMVFLLAILAFVITGAITTGQYLAYKRAPSRHFHLLLTMNLVTVLLMLATGEMVIRIVSRSSIEGETLGGAVLRPKNWETLARHYRELIDRVGGDLSYLVYDDLMGWTVGANRRSANGLYRSSSEGIRAPEEGVPYAKVTGKTSIALAGDSFTFGEDAKFDETWGYFLGKQLGSDYQVLNFGVSGYGVDQIFLRYEKDIRTWKPKVVIFGFISHDVERTMFVYPFLSFPEWNMPFAKSRFILRDGELENINVPPLSPEAIFSRWAISDLPSVDYHKGYKKGDWQRSFYHVSYLSRAFMTWFPRWEAVPPDVSEEARVSVNAAIMKAFVRSATRAGSIPFVVYFPNMEELDQANFPRTIGKRALERANIAYTDLTSCLLKLDAAERFGPLSRHYSSTGNAAVAECLVNDVRQALAQSSLR
jgi:hypothetical protein